MKLKESELITSKDAQEKLLNRVKALESKLLSGGKNIIDHTNEQQRALEMRRNEIAEQKVSSLTQNTFRIISINLLKLEIFSSINYKKH